MNRNQFIKIIGVSALPASGQLLAIDPKTDAQRIRTELLEAWQSSERMTLKTAEQMPADRYGFRYTPEAMSFAEQWRHCCVFTAGQLAGRLGVVNPYQTQKLPKDMTKEQVIGALKTFYAYVQTVIRTVSDEKLFAPTEFVDGAIPGWRLLYAMENHIIHHRGQCMVYLRLKGITPEGYVGW